MRNHHGDFIWYELMTADPDAAADFYRAVVGWKTREADGSNRGYRIFGTGETDIGGLFTLTGDLAAQPSAWVGYIGVDDVDKSAADVTGAGGTIHVPPTDIPGVGRFAMASDPQGAMFYVMRGATDMVSASFAGDKVGHCQWNELATSDPVAAFAFYSGRFGWEKDIAMPMGELGEYQLFKNKGPAIGAVQKDPSGRGAAWTFYFGVANIDDAVATVSELGGTVHVGPMEVPGGSWIIVASDPKGATFGLSGPRKQ